jgi:hypothetical protein
LERPTVFCFCAFVSVYPCLFPHIAYSSISHPLSTFPSFFVSFASLCSRILLVRQIERLLESVAGSSVPSGLNLNCQRTFKKPSVIGRRGCYRELSTGKTVSRR